MQIIGVEMPGGNPVFSESLPHGGDPHRLAWQHGYRLIRPLSVTGRSPELTLTVQVGRHGRSAELPPARTRSIDPDLDLSREPEPLVRQRIAAYGIVLSDRGLLATQFSELTAVPGLWGLPGGGIKPGESPARALLREVMEETGQRVRIEQLLDIQTDHWIGRSPSRVVEDFHAVRIIYAAVCTRPGEPVVNDVGGTTADARWMSPDAWEGHPWSMWAKVMLERHLTERRSENSLP